MQMMSSSFNENSLVSKSTMHNLEITNQEDTKHQDGGTRLSHISLYVSLPQSFIAKTFFPRELKSANLFLTC